ncbi:MAG: DUF4199 domain-containing protein [Bacteroidetes bacterium]|nr:DUF4199 domain-containing protein [Bacteroidota bacterium]HET6245662.1 DUF4199 domain-containing protein [Bacteroidia bacterium]
MDPEKTHSDQYQFNLVMKYGLLATAGYVVVFFIMSLLNLHIIPELRGLNYLILLITASVAINTFKKQSQNQMSYLKGFLTGLFVAILSFAFFALLMYIYLKFLDPEFLQFIVDYSPMGITLTPLSAALLLFMEGQAVGIVSALILMQFFKKNINKISKTI